MARSFFWLVVLLAAAMPFLPGTGEKPVRGQSGGTTRNPAGLSSPGRSAYPEITQVVKILREGGSIIEATKKAEEASRNHPELPTPHVLMYQILTLLHRPDLARYQLDEAVQTNPDDPEPYLLLGSMALQDRRSPEAEMGYEKAYQLLAKYQGPAQRKEDLLHGALSGIAQVAEVRQNWHEAELRLRDLLKLAPTDVTAQQRLARALFWQGKAQETYDVLKAAKEIDRAEAKKHNQRESMLTPEAIMGKYYAEYEGPNSKTPPVWFKAAVEYAPKDLATRECVALWALDTGNVALAKEQANAILEIEKSDQRRYAGSKTGHMLRGLVALWEKHWLDAEGDFETILLLDPTDYRAKNNLALALVQQADPAKQRKATDFAEENHKNYRTNPDVLSTLCWVYYCRNQNVLAETTLGQYLEAVGRDVRDPDTLTYFAHVIARQNKTWDAKNLLEMAMGTGRKFSMLPEAQRLYEKVKNAKKPESATGTRLETPGTRPANPERTP